MDVGMLAFCPIVRPGKFLNDAGDADGFQHDIALKSQK